MSRAYLVYILTFVFLAAGLWVIFTLGGAMRAPDDLAGEWDVAWAGPLPPGASEPVMHVSQSGRFFVVRFGEGKPLGLTLTEPWQGARNGRVLKMQLSGAVWRIDLRGDIPLRATRHIPEVSLTLSGPSQHVGVARRREPLATKTLADAGMAHAR